MPALDQAVDEIEQLKARVVDVSSRNVRYSLISDTGSKPVAQQQLPAGDGGGKVAAANMLAEASRAQGGGGDLTQLITKNFHKDHDLQVISVWGSGGDHGTASTVMKTYRDTEIRKTFTYRAWVKLMHPFNPRDLIRSMMSQFCAAHNCIDEEQDAAIGMEVLFKKFQGLVTQATYLVVVEGLSNMAEWHELRTYLPNGRKGSWIVVSTQQPEIASLCIEHSYQILELKQFSAEHSVCALFKEGSHGHRDGNKGKKPMEAESYSLDGRESLIDQLRQYPGKARIESCQVMSVWGIAGVGKSALVKQLFDYSICDKRQFQEYRWVDVSHPFNIRDFHRSIPSEYSLTERSWLVVIDDIHSKQEWDLMQSSLVVPISSRSLIIVITTDASIAVYCSSAKDFVFNVKALEDAAATSLFAKVCRTNKSITTKDLEKSEVKELILKCGGLPKVIIAIAGVLAKQTVKWTATVVSLNQRFVQDLRTKPSYDSLCDLFGWMDSFFRTCPDSLKPCIFYLSIFPREHRIRRRRLVRRFIAEGYSRDGPEEFAEDIGEKQLSELLDLSIIHQVPHLVTNPLNTRMVWCQVNGFIHEYIIPQRKEENLVFELGGNSAITTQRTGRHLIILKDWNRDIIVFKSMDFSRLRSITVFGRWKKILISENMKLLRVLDLEDAEGLEYEDLENIVKWLGRLKFLSLRGRREIHHLSSNMDHLRQLETLDVRGTSIVTLPESITKLQKLQYIRGGNSDISTSNSSGTSSWIPEFCRHRPIVGVMVPTEIRNLTALHTLGVVNVASSGGKAMVKALKKLTQLRKLGVSGINRKNCKDFSSLINCHVHLESLSVHLDNNIQGCLDRITLPLGKLRSLKLYGLNENLPKGSQQLVMLRKLELNMHTLTEIDIALLGKLPELCILRLRIKQPIVHFIAKIDGAEESTFKKVKILEISYSSGSLCVKFGSDTMKTLELLNLDCSSGTSSYDLTIGPDLLPELKEVLLIGCNDETFKTELAKQLRAHPKNPVLKQQPRSS